MIIANEGKKNMEVRANFIEPRGCGCLTSQNNKASVRDLVCTCGCGYKPSLEGNASAAGVSA